MIADRLWRARRTVLQRSCACASGGSCRRCGTGEVQRADLVTGEQRREAAAPRPAPPDVRDVVHQPGRPLDEATRRDHERRVGHDLRAIRIHDDQAAATAAATIDASAFTVGQHIVFGAGRYRPATPDGRELLAHELVHATEHQEPLDSRGPDLGSLRIGEPDSTDEQAARRAAGANTRTPR